MHGTTVKITQGSYLKQIFNTVGPHWNIGLRIVIPKSACLNRVFHFKQRPYQFQNQSLTHDDYYVMNHFKIFAAQIVNNQPTSTYWVTVSLVGTDVSGVSCQLLRRCASHFDELSQYLQYGLISYDLKVWKNGLLNCSRNRTKYLCTCHYLTALYQMI